MGETEKWEAILKAEGLSLSSGQAPWLVFVDNTDKFQRERPRPIGVDGGLLAREYRLGEAREIKKTCEQCEESFSSIRQDARFCSPRCRKRSSRKVTDTAQDSGELANAA